MATQKKQENAETAEDEQARLVSEAEPIRFTYDGRDYTLEYNRASLKVLEKRFDFSMEDLENSKVTAIPDMFYCAFLMHHSGTSRQDADAILALMSDKGRLAQQLALLYYKAANSILDEPSEGEAIRW